MSFIDYQLLKKYLSLLSIENPWERFFLFPLHKWTDHSKNSTSLEDKKPSLLLIRNLFKIFYKNKQTNKPKQNDTQNFQVSVLYIKMWRM